MYLYFTSVYSVYIGNFYLLPHNIYLEHKNYICLFNMQGHGYKNELCISM